MNREVTYKMSMKRGINNLVIAELIEEFRGDRRVVCAGSLEAVADVFIEKTSATNSDPTADVESYN